MKIQVVEPVPAVEGRVTLTLTTLEASALKSVLAELPSAGHPALKMCNQLFADLYYANVPYFYTRHPIFDGVPPVNKVPR